MAKRLLGEQLQSLFKEADRDKSGTIDKQECYILVLKVYLYVSQYMAIAQTFVPNQDYIDHCFEKFDTSKRNLLGFEEFKQLIYFLFPDLIGRLTLQMLLRFVVFPTLAAFFIDATSKYVLGNNVARVEALWDEFLNKFSFLPASILDLLDGPLIAVIVVSSLIRMILMPFIMQGYEKRMDKIMEKTAKKLE